MKFVAVAAIGSVNACWFKEHAHKPLMGMLEPAKHCPKTDVPRLNHIQAYRELAKNSYTGLMKGWYQENHDVISDQCFGAWMEPTFMDIHDLKKKMHEDFWSVSLHDVKHTGGQFLDTMYKNMDLCQFERVGDDAKTWCLANPAQCIYLENLEERLFDNMFEMMGSFFDLIKMFIKDDSCYTDMEQMAEIYRLNADIGELAASLSGYDYKWDQSVERTHIKKHEFHIQIKQAIHDLKEQYKSLHPIELMFPDLEPIIEVFREWIRNMKAHFRGPTPAQLEAQLKTKYKDTWGSLPTRQQILSDHQHKKQAKPQHHKQHSFFDLFKPHHTAMPQHQQQQMPHHQQFGQWGAFQMPQMHQFDLGGFKLF